MSEEIGSNTDRAEWAELVDSYYKEIFRFCCQILGSTAEAEDVTQEVFIKAFKHRRALRDRAALRAWLYTIARNLCRDKQRWWSRTAKTLHDYFSTETAPPPSTLTASFQAIIQSLPMRQREVFILRHFHEFSTAETAAQLGIDEGSVKSHLKRAVDRLKSVLTKAEERTTENEVGTSLNSSCPLKAKNGRELS